MSKAVEAQIGVQEECKAALNASEATRAWQRFRNPKGKHGPPIELGTLDQHGLAAAFIVAQLGPKLDAIERRLMRLELPE